MPALVTLQMTRILFLLPELPDRSCHCSQHTSSCEVWVWLVWRHRISSPKTFGDRITDWLRLKGASGGHLVQIPAHTPGTSCPGPRPNREVYFLSEMLLENKMSFLGFYCFYFLLIQPSLFLLSFQMSKKERSISPKGLLKSSLFGQGWLPGTPWESGRGDEYVARIAQFFLQNIQENDNSVPEEASLSISWPYRKTGWLVWTECATFRQLKISWGES